MPQSGVAGEQLGVAGERPARDQRGPAGERPARALLDEAERLLSAARVLGADDGAARAEVQRALRPLRAKLAAAELAQIPVARLRDVTEGRLRLGSLEQAGYSTVQQVLDATPYRLQLVPGVGPQTAAQAKAAAGQIARAVERTVTVRIDVDQQDDPGVTELVMALHRLVTAGPDLPPAVELARRLEGALDPLVREARPARGRLRMFFARGARREQVTRAVAQLERLLADARARDALTVLRQASVDLLRPVTSGVQAWTGFELDPAEYYNLLIEIAGLEPERLAAEGFLPDQIADRVHAQPLDDAFRRVSLRGYQSFGARFALAQQRVILGDEMGLGKTIQAIAALAHLRARGDRHFLVACPVSVLINWMREVETRSRLSCHRLHGPEREDAFAEWLAEGGVAVTTIDGLHALPVPAGVRVGMFIVDEAHYAKNPDARRSRAVARWADSTERVLFLTGTPMENRVEEFRNLVHYLRPALVEQIGNGDGAAGSRAFRRAVAPAYLRRNQEDVLTELPELMHVDEWEELGAADMDAYREAVAAGNFMAMRRAAYRHPDKSAKLERLQELVEEAAETHLKVLIFSFFHDVLAAVGARLGPGLGPKLGPGLGSGVFGPLSGKTPPLRRQQMVDAFTAAPGHAVLLTQIQVGGVGLNLQAASVVILCEPQVKPTTESQAVARAHRMGQIRKVQVHRLLAADSVDQRMLEILHRKIRLFDSYARRSDVAEASPDAIDISEQELARQIVEAEQRRLALSDGMTGG
jgi:superfamily II DNA or RNA helicase